MLVVQRPRAKADLAEIWKYIAEDSERRADAFIDTIDEKFQMLARQPGIGRRREELQDGIRSFPVGRYLVFYLVIPDGIEVLRVLHSARDIDEIFHGED